MQLKSTGSSKVHLKDDIGLLRFDLSEFIPLFFFFASSNTFALQSEKKMKLNCGMN
jgi:hypothetical protein